MNCFFKIKYVLIPLLFIFLHSTTSAQTIRYVEAGGTGSGTSWNDASGDLQAMINASDSGNQVWVAKGTYTSQSYVAMKAGVGMYGGFIGNEVSISARNFVADTTNLMLSIYNLADSNLTPSAVIDGFYFTGGQSLRNVSASPTISNCVFIGTDSTSVPNGTINNSYASSPIITNCVFINNTATNGGAIYNNKRCAPIISGCTFNSNTGFYGGGIRLDYDSNLVVITNCVFNNNTSTSVTSAGGISSTHSFYKITNCTFNNDSANYAGAIWCTLDSSASIIANCVFTGNKSTNYPSSGAGALNITHESPTIINCAFNNNSGFYAGAVYNYGSGSSPTFTNCVFNGNTCNESLNTNMASVGAIYNSATTAITITNCTFYKNAGLNGGAIYNASSSVFPKIYNSIFWGNYIIGDDAIIGGADIAKFSSEGNSVIANSLLQSTQNIFGRGDTLKGINLFATDPLFADTSLIGDPLTVNDGLMLQKNSPCINAGDTSLLPANDATDIDGAARVQGNSVDMGAYETSYSSIEGNDVYLSVANTFVCPASQTSLAATIDIPLTVVHFDSLVSLQGSIIWDTSLLKFNSVNSPYPGIGLSTANFNSTTPGNLLFSWLDNSLTGKSVPDSSTLFTIRFDVVPGNFGKKTLLKISNQLITLEAVQYPQKDLTVIPQSNLVNFSVAPSSDTSILNGCDSVVFRNVVYKNATVVYDTLTNINGCDSVYRTFNVQPQHKLSISAISNSPLNTGDTIKLNVVGETPANASVSWSGPNSFSSSEFNPVIPFATIVNAGIYKLSASNTCGIDSFGLSIVVNPSISGRIITPLNIPIHTVSLLNNDTVVGNYTGSYQYGEALNTPLVLRLSKNNDVDKSNGVSAVDILLIQSDILQKKLLNGPYKLIAADVNSSNTITSADLVYIQQLILGVDTTFPGNKLWAFVDSSYVFPDPANPFPYKDSIYFDKYSSVLNNQTFIGVKLGDVNDDWDSSLLRPAGTTNVQLYYDTIQVYNNSTEIMIPLRVRNFNDLLAIQYTLNFNKNTLAFAGVANSNLNNLQFADNHKDNGTLSFLWVDDSIVSHTLPDGSIIMNLVFTKIAPFVQENISITSDVTNAEAWDSSFIEHSIVKTDGEIITVDSSTDTENWTLFPNPAKDKVTISYNVLQSKEVYFELLDLQGKMISTQTAQLSTSPGQIDFNFNPSGKIAAGQYYIKAVGIGNNIVRKIIVTN